MALSQNWDLDSTISGYMFACVGNHVTSLHASQQDTDTMKQNNYVLTYQYIYKNIFLFNHIFD